MADTRTIDITARIANLDKLKQQLQGMTVNVKLESSQLDQLLKISKSGVKIDVKLNFGKELQQLLDLQKKGITLRTGVGASPSAVKVAGQSTILESARTARQVADARAAQVLASEEISFRQKVTQQHFQDLRNEKTIEDERASRRAQSNRQLKAYMDANVKRDQEYLKSIKNAGPGNAFGSSFTFAEPGLGTSSKVDYGARSRRQALEARQRKAEVLLERRIEEANRRIADSPIEFLLGGGSELIGKEASKLGVNPSKLRQSPSFFDPKRLRDTGNARDVLFSTLLGGPVQGAGAALGAVTLGGPLGALVGGTVAEGIVHSFERIGEALKEASRAADEFDKAAAAITGGLLSTSRVIDTATGTRVNSLDEIGIQQQRGRSLQLAATKELLNLGIGGEAAASLSGALIHTRTTQGFAPSPETVALLSRRFGAFQQLAAPDISPNRLGVDINDILGQTANAKSTTLGSRLLRVSPELFSGRKLNDEELIKATESLDDYVRAIKESGDAFRQRAIIEGQLKNANRELGDVVNRITLPALAGLAGFLEGLADQLHTNFPGLFPKNGDKSKGTVTETNPDVEIKRILDSVGIDTIKDLEDFKKKSPEFRTSVIDEALSRIGNDPELKDLFDQFSLLRDKLEQLITAQENLAKTFDTFKFDQLIDQAKFRASSAGGIVDTAQASLTAAESGLSSAIAGGNAEAIRAAQAKISAAEQDLAKALIARSNAERSITEAIVQRAQAERKLRNAGEAVEDQAKNEILQRRALTRSIEESRQALKEFGSNAEAARAGKEGGILGAARAVIDAGGNVPGDIQAALDDPEIAKQYALTHAAARLNAELESVGRQGTGNQGGAYQIVSNTGTGSFQLGLKNRFEELQDSIKRTQDELDKLPRSLRDLKEALDDLVKLLKPRLDGTIPEELRNLQPAGSSPVPGGSSGGDQAPLSVSSTAPGIIRNSKVVKDLESKLDGNKAGPKLVGGAVKDFQGLKSLSPKLDIELTDEEKKRLSPQELKGYIDTGAISQETLDRIRGKALTIGDIPVSQGPARAGSEPNKRNLLYPGESTISTSAEDGAKLFGAAPGERMFYEGNGGFMSSVLNLYHPKTVDTQPALNAPMGDPSFLKSGYTQDANGYITLPGGTKVKTQADGSFGTDSYLSGPDDNIGKYGASFFRIGTPDANDKDQSPLVGQTSTYEMDFLKQRGFSPDYYDPVSRTPNYDISTGATYTADHPDIINGIGGFKVGDTIPVSRRQRDPEKSAIFDSAVRDLRFNKGLPNYSATEQELYGIRPDGMKQGTNSILQKQIEESMKGIAFTFGATKSGPLALTKAADIQKRTAIAEELFAASGDESASPGATEARLRGGNPTKTQLDTAGKILKEFTDSRESKDSKDVNNPSIFEKLGANLGKPLTQDETTMAFVNALNQSFV